MSRAKPKGKPRKPMVVWAVVSNDGDVLMSLWSCARDAMADLKCRATWGIKYRVVRFVESPRKGK